MFNHGDKVRRKDNHAKIGVVKIFDDDPPQTAGKVRVYWFYASRTKLVRTRDIELIPKEPDTSTLT